MCPMFWEHLTIQAAGCNRAATNLVISYINKTLLYVPIHLAIFLWLKILQYINSSIIVHFPKCNGACTIDVYDSFLLFVEMPSDVFV